MWTTPSRYFLYICLKISQISVFLDITTCVVSHYLNNHRFHRVRRPVEAPCFLRGPVSSHVLEGDSLTVTCDVVGDPAPEVSWRREDPGQVSPGHPGHVVHL